MPNSLVLNEVNTVSGGNFLDKGRGDMTFGRVEGNGQNWLEFLVVQGDQTASGYKHTLDLRGWTINWSYDKDNLHTQFGAGTIQFTQDPLWASVPLGSLVTVSEWQDAWYNVNTPPGYDPVPGAGGLQRDGGINGLGHLRGNAFKSDGSDIHLGAATPADDPHLLATDTSWNPAANGGGSNGDWLLHVFAGERNPDTSFKYFNFSGSVTDTTGTHAIGTDDGGLFVANNDEWQYTIKDAQGNVIQGPIGEHLPGSNFGVNPNEIERLEAFSDRLSQPTQAQYLGATIGNYESGSSSTYGSPNVWNSGDDHQGLLALRSWLQPGDADLDGTVTAADYVLWRSHAGTAGDWRSGDFDGDGMVDQADYAIWRAHFGDSAGTGSDLGSATVPEPGICVLLAIGTMLLSSRRRLPR
ncbi:MAG TPA: dockerin type I repeat-containing protein [Lacipirellulaceae bacterium]|nr:dockerin type I repeat-containing protein [Lacipirellulaceae bacterium]